MGGDSVRDESWGGAAMMRQSRRGRKTDVTCWYSIFFNRMADGHSIGVKIGQMYLEKFAVRHTL
jgi:hypothetical protein